MTTLDEALAAIRRQTKDRKDVLDTLPKRECVGLTEEDITDAAQWVSMRLLKLPKQN